MRTRRQPYMVITVVLKMEHITPNMRKSSLHISMQATGSLINRRACAHKTRWDKVVDTTSIEVGNIFHRDETWYGKGNKHC